MAEQVKVFKNVIDVAVPVTATTVSLHTTSATQRAVIKDIDCLNLGKNVTLDLDGRTMNSGTDAGVLERTKNLIMGPSSTLSLKFPAKPATAYKGMMFFYGTEGFQLVEGDGLTAAFNSQTQITTTSNSTAGHSGAVHVHSTTGVVTYLTLYQGNVKVYEDATGAEIDSYPLDVNAGQVYQFCTDGTYLYGVNAFGNTIHRKHIESLANTDFTVSGMAYPASNQGSYVVHHNGKLYSKTNGNSSIVTILDIATAVVTSKTANTGTSRFAVGGYSDGGGVLTTTAGVTYIVEQGTDNWYYWNLSTDVVTRTGNGSATSTEYGNGFTQIAPGVALILGEETDRATVIDMNTSPPTWSTTLKPQHDFTLNKTANTYGSSFTIAGGVVAIPARSYTALCAGIDITED